MNQKPKNSGARFIRTFLFTVVVIVIFAYGFQVTKINLEEPKKEQRQSQLINVLRALARPDLVSYETERLQIEAPILIPCPAAPVALPNLTMPDGPVIELSVPCAESASDITVSGSGFAAGEDVFLFFVPYTANVADEVELKLVNQRVVTDKSGAFSVDVALKKGRTAAEPQKVRAVVNRTSGLPFPTETVYQTIEKIIETIFLALIATTLGTILSIPVSFMAARNLMIQITSLFGQMVALVAMAPLGWVLGSWAFRGLGSWGAGLIAGGQIPPAAALWAPALLLFTVQAAIPHADNTAPWVSTMRRFGLSVLLAAAAALVLGLVAGLGQVTGTSLAGLLGPFAFFGNFLFVLADSLAVFLPLIGGFTGMFILISLTGVVSEHLLYRAGNSALGKVFTVVMAVLAGAVLVGLPAAFIGWLYELKPTFANLWLPALLGAAALGLVSLALKPTHPMPTGMIIYFASRTILNVLRAIEPLIMAIVFVVWVGIGPFAGVMALMLHTIASLGKLYSEQVENISEGPIEAVTATGANRLQTIIYAVMPQIVPPYIAFTIYRWDINVRMSTIIGFAGGGGIGFLLQQNLNLLKYRQASVQMIAIAIVVSTLDFVSAKIRERIV